MACLRLHIGEAELKFQTDIWIPAHTLFTVLHYSHD